jgi:hypothetical protein
MFRLEGRGSDWYPELEYGPTIAALEDKYVPHEMGFSG